MRVRVAPVAVDAAAGHAGGQARGSPLRRGRAGPRDRREERQRREQLSHACVLQLYTLRGGFKLFRSRRHYNTVQ